MYITRPTFKSAAPLLTLAAMIVFMAGCSNGDSGTGGPTSTGTGEPPTVELPPDPSLPGSSTSSGEAPAAGGWGTLRGKFVYDAAEAPKQVQLSVTKDVEVCTKVHPLDESLVVNPENKGIANVVVFLMPEDGQEVPVHESYKTSAGETVLFDNKNCRFAPHVCLLRTSQTFEVGNSDPVGHNTNIASVDNPQFNQLVPANSKMNVTTFTMEERLPVRVNCNIHPWMTGWVVVKSNPYFAVTDENGEFEIANLPTGRWKFRLWQETAGYVSSATVDGKEVSWPRGIVEKDISEGDMNTLGEIKLKPEAFQK